MRRYFDPDVYRVVLFDQRGCGRSRPHAEVRDNTTWHLISDIELIRETLGIDDFLVFGGSWGATLSLLYAETHPERVRALVLRGVFLMTPPELDWFYGGGAARFFPDTWSEFAALIPEDERDDMIAAYSKRLFSGDAEEELRFARAWAGWENALASIETTGRTGQSPTEYARAFARLENHYFTNLGFLGSENYILEHVERLHGIPGVIVQGRNDMICPPQAAWNLHRAWPGSDLRLIPKSGHALSEPGLSAELVRAVKEFQGL